MDTIRLAYLISLFRSLITRLLLPGIGDNYMAN